MCYMFLQAAAGDSEPLYVLEVLVHCSKDSLKNSATEIAKPAAPAEKGEMQVTYRCYITVPMSLHQFVFLSIPQKPHQLSFFKNIPRLLSLAFIYRKPHQQEVIGQGRRTCHYVNLHALRHGPCFIVVCVHPKSADRWCEVSVKWEKSAYDSSILHRFHLISLL